MPSGRAESEASGGCLVLAPALQLNPGGRGDVPDVGFLPGFCVF